MVIKVAGQEYTVSAKKKHKKSQSLGSITDFHLSRDSENDNADKYKSCDGDKTNLAYGRDINRNVNVLDASLAEGESRFF